MFLEKCIGRQEQFHDVHDGQSTQQIPELLAVGPININSLISSKSKSIKVMSASNSFKVISNSIKNAKFYFFNGTNMNMKLNGLNSSYQYLLWIPCGFCFGLLNVYIYSAQEFGNPLVYDSVDAYSCAFMCGIFWMYFL